MLLKNQLKNGTAFERIERQKGNENYSRECLFVQEGDLEDFNQPGRLETNLPSPFQCGFFAQPATFCTDLYSKELLLQIHKKVVAKMRRKISV